MEIEFPIEFLVRGTPVSHQTKRRESLDQWKALVQASSSMAIPNPHFASDARMSVTLYYLPDEPRSADVDNIAKGVLDALSKHIYLDDGQVERLVVQKFEPGNVFEFNDPSEAMLEALTGAKPVLYIRVSDNPLEELK